MSRSLDFDWADLAFGSKKQLNALQATFIPAPRDMSIDRFKQIIKQYLPGGNIVLGVADEPFVLGYENQPQFRLFDVALAEQIIDHTHKNNLQHKVYTLRYKQHELPFIIEAVDFTQLALVNGSWKLAFQNTKTFYALTKRQTPYELISSFTDEAEAKTYAISMAKLLDSELDATLPNGKAQLDDTTLMAIAHNVARTSFDHCFQVGAVLAQSKSKGYEIICYGPNMVVPHESYALHYGSIRERLLLPPNDQSQYDTIHAEMVVMNRALSQNINFSGKTLAVTSLPCPSCARNLCQTGLDEVIYQHDHSDGYAIRLFNETGIKTRRIVL